MRCNSTCSIIKTSAYYSLSNVKLVLEVQQWNTWRNTEDTAKTVGERGSPLDHSRTNTNKIAPWIIISAANRYYRHTISLGDKYRKNTSNDNYAVEVHVNQHVNNHLALQRLRPTRSCGYYHYLCWYNKLLNWF